MRRRMPFTNTAFFYKKLPRLEMMQLFFKDYFEEIRNGLLPLPGICTKAINNTKADEKIDMVKAAIEFVLNITDKIERSVRLDFVNTKVERSAIKLGPWLEAFIEEFHNYSNYTERPELFISGPLEETTVETDPIMLKQVLNFLLKNAFYNSEDDTPVRIKCKKQNDRLLIEVHNVGIISTENQDEIFRPYLKGKEEIPATGFGLYLCLAFVEALNGSIEAACNNNMTVFTIALSDLFHDEPLFKSPDI